MGRVVGARVAIAFACAALAAGACGCFVVGERCVLVEQFTEDQARAIRNGETTKKEILARLGPPAFAGRPDPGAADNAVRRFAAADGGAQGRIVYRYDASTLTWASLCAYGQYGGGCNPSTPVNKVRTLWILIDGTTGRVVDHAVVETEREENRGEISPWPGP